MDNTEKAKLKVCDQIADSVLYRALNELGRSINLVTTYGTNHPVAHKALGETTAAMQALFTSRRKITIGAFNGVMTIDGKTVQTVGTLQKSLERRLVRLKIIGLKISRATSREEFGKLAELLAVSDPDAFQQNFGNSGIENIQAENTEFQAVGEGQTVANESDLGGSGGSGVLVLEDELEGGGEAGRGSTLHVEQIVAFLKGDLDVDSDAIGDELTEMASNPDQLGRMIMESVAIRQSVSELSGESLNDIILGCLRRTYDGLRKQAAFQSAEGKADLKKALLLLEESVLDKMRKMTGEEDSELDRKIVQAVREMENNLSFEAAAAEYMEHREAIELNKEQLQSFIQSQGSDVAEGLLKGSGFPGSDWRRIVVESGKSAPKNESAISDGISRLTEVFDKLDALMKSKDADGNQMMDLLGQANENLGDTLDCTKEKLEVLSSTIGGQARTMPREELLASLAEVAQELMQPLTAVNASLEMMLKGYAGEISKDQQDMLTIASNSGEHLKYLMHMLIEIVGCPANKGIDDRFHTTSDEVQQLKDVEDHPHQPINL